MGQVADRGAFGGTHLLDLLLGVQLVISPGHYGIGRDDLYRLVELFAEAGGQVGMAVDHRVHRIAQAARVQRAGHGDVELQRVQITEIPCGAGVEEQSLLQRGQR